MKTKVKPFQIAGHVIYAIAEDASDEKCVDLRGATHGPGGHIAKALPKKDKSAAPAKKAKANGAAEKKAGKNGKTRYTYPQEKAGGQQQQAPQRTTPQPQQQPIPVPPQPQPPQANPADLANQLGVSLHMLQRIAQRFVTNPQLGGRKGFIVFMKTRLKDVVDKHQLDGDYFGLIFDALTGSPPPAQ